MDVRLCAMAGALEKSGPGPPHSFRLWSVHLPAAQPDEHDWTRMTRFFRFAPLLLLLAPCLAFAQSYTVNGPFVASTYHPMDGAERWQRWWSEDGGSPTVHLHTLLVAGSEQIVNDRRP